MSLLFFTLHSRWDLFADHYRISQTAFSDKDDQLRQILIKLDTIDSAEPLTSEDLTHIRRQLSEGQSLLKETVDKLRQSQEENDLLAKRKDELETRITGLETEYEELLGKLQLHWIRSK